MRAKNMDDEHWVYLNQPEDLSHDSAEYRELEFECSGTREICTYFPAGFVPEL